MYPGHCRYRRQGVAAFECMWSKRCCKVVTGCEKATMNF
jgi:hypothetical protein